MSLSFGTFITWASLWLPGSYCSHPRWRSRDQPMQLGAAAAGSKLLHCCKSQRAKDFLKHGILSNSLPPISQRILRWLRLGNVSTSVAPSEIPVQHFLSDTRLTNVCSRASSHGLPWENRAPLSPSLAQGKGTRQQGAQKSLRPACFWIYSYPLACKQFSFFNTISDSLGEAMMIFSFPGEDEILTSPFLPRQPSAPWVSEPLSEVSVTHLEKGPPRNLHCRRPSSSHKWSHLHERHSEGLGAAEKPVRLRQAG